MRRVRFAVLLVVAGCSTEQPNPNAAPSDAQASALDGCDPTKGSPAQWTTDEVISPCGRPNPLAVASPDQYIAAGTDHVLHYPVEITGIKIPYKPLYTVIEGDTNNWLRKALAWVLPKITGISKVDDLYQALGLVKAPDGTRWGVTVLDTDQGQGLTFSCATCHTGALFGKPVFGLFNRRSRANAMFIEARPGFDYVTPGMFDFVTGATDGERQMWADAREHMHYVQSKEPAARGLDTALAHTMLSLARRGNDEWASLDDSWQNPRPTELETHSVDVKPATWWLTKYKTKYFSDGSLVSGNPVLGALLVNELGRGTDLHVLDAWIDANWQKVEELTTAVFSAEPPSYFDFFPAEQFDMAAAKRGQTLFVAHCQHCHGTYAKGWDAQDAATRTTAQLLATTDVRYFESTNVKNVGTDPDRASGIAYMQSINDLALAKKYNLVLTPQQGYVPPPLVGIFARWPYFHNGSAPSLCAVLTKADDRPATYVYGEVVDRNTEFDSACNGFPVTPAPGFEDVYDTSLPGLTNRGHDEGIFLKNGVELLTPADKQDLIRFLQTL